MKKFLTLSFLLFLFVPVLWATNIRIENIVIVERNDAERYIVTQFDLTWDYSFRVDDDDNTNWDAAWVFMKFKDVFAPDNVQWGHATLANTGHNIPGNFTYSMGATDAANKGIFIYPSVVFANTAQINGVQLRWNYGADGLEPEDEVDIRVFGIEMVYVPTGSFYVGSGGNEINRFHAGGEENTVPFQIGDIPFTVDNSAGQLWATGERQSGTFNSDYPKGYNAFYMMKHNVTQQAYVDFLNTLTYEQQDARIDGSPGAAAGTFSNDNARHKIKIAIQGSSGSLPAVYETDHPYVPVNWVSTQDVLAYLDWAALRPYTELEYEKAARGPASPVPNEYAWGNTLIGNVTEVENYGLPTERPTPSGFVRDITIDRTKVSEDLEEFTVLVRLNDENFDFDDCRPDGLDIEFVDFNGNTLEFQRERHDYTAKKAEYWVHIPNVYSTQNTVFTMLYGNPFDDEDGAANDADVWTNDLISLWHLHENEGPFVDSKGSNDGTWMSGITRVEGQIGYAQQFDGASFILVNDDTSLDVEDEITISAWIKPQELTPALLSESLQSHWNMNHQLDNLNIVNDNLIIADFNQPSVRITQPIPLDHIKRVGSSLINWDANFGYHIEAFTSDGLFSVPPGVTEVDVLVVGGGGSGASTMQQHKGGGGGAGGLIFEPGYDITSYGSTIIIKVGSGGEAIPDSQEGGNPVAPGQAGQNSSFGGLIAHGGGGGGQRDQAEGSNDGGSGGGGHYDLSGGTAIQPGSASGGFGNPGGSGGDAGHGGGGAGSAGNNDDSGLTADGEQYGGRWAGGDGLNEVTIEGTIYNFADLFGTQYGEEVDNQVWFAGGGGGGINNDGASSYGAGGRGGGGRGAFDGDGDGTEWGSGSPKGEDGMPNTGGGGGGARGGISGAGGSGIVLVRYLDPNSVRIYTAINESATTPPDFDNMQVFTSNGTFTVPDGIKEVDVLIVAGGGGGGGSAGPAASGAGGGAGGVVYAQNIQVTETSYAIEVGAGGGSGGSSSDTQGSDGGNSSAFGLTAIGGGGGGSRASGNADGKDGGSGGGVGSHQNGGFGIGLQPGSASAGFGSNGGDSGFSGNTSDDNASGGGGGAGGAGSSGLDNVRSGNGGIGRYFGHRFGNDVGDEGWFAGGGGGGNPGGSRITGLGGKGGGADGGSNNAFNAIANTGGGGGGAGANGAPSDGGSGIVIVRWGHATPGDPIPGISEGDDLTGKYLWVKQELISNNPVFSPELISMDLEVAGEAIIAGKGEAYKLTYYEDQLRGYINNNRIDVTGMPLSFDEYQHVALTYNGSVQRLFVNGLIRATQNYSEPITTIDDDLLIGFNMEGEIDELRIYNPSRSQAWVAAESYSGTGSLVQLGGQAQNNNAVFRVLNWGDGIEEGPMRVGFGATPESSRTSAGASYWGIMELSGNLYEWTVSAGLISHRTNFNGLHGDGLLNADGSFNIANWPTDLRIRGGSWSFDNLSRLRISDRRRMDEIFNDTSGYEWSGIRGVRTAP